MLVVLPERHSENNIEYLLKTMYRSSSDIDDDTTQENDFNDDDDQNEDNDYDRLVCACEEITTSTG